MRIATSFKSVLRRTRVGATDRLLRSSGSYLVAAGTALAAAFVRWQMDGLWGTKHPLLTFYPAVAVAAWIGGLGPGVLATLVSTACAAILFLAPYGTFRLSDPADVIALGLFVAVNLLVSALIQGLRSARRRVEQTGAEAEARLHDVEALLVVNRVLGQTLSLSELGPKVCHVVRELVGADGATFVLREGRRVRYLAEDAIAPLWTGQSFPIERCISGWSILHRETAAVEDVYEDDRIPVEAYRPTFVRSLVMVPMRRDADVVGAMGAYWSRPHRASDREVSLLEGVVGALSAAVANAHLFADMAAAKTAADGARAEAEHAVHQLRRIQSITDAAITDLPFDELLHELLRRVRHAAATDAAAIFLRAPDGDVLVCRAAEGLEVEAQARIPVGRGPSGRLAGDEVGYEAAVSRFLGGRGIRSFFGVPLRGGDRLLGVLAVASMAQRRFRDDEAKLLQLVAERIALAVERGSRNEAERRAREAAEEANRAKDDFLAMLGHELRNPLAAIHSALAVVDLDETRRERGLAIARRQSVHLGRLVDDLLDVARITRGKINLREEDVFLGSLVERAVEASRSLIDQRGHLLSVVVQDEMLAVRGDAGRLEQVVVNLVRNAAKYTDPGGTIALSVEREGGDAVLRVRDSGIGLAPDMLPRIWEPFAQADRTLDRSQGGLGIGLTVARRLIELHGGRIDVRSEGVGRGSEFLFRLPALPPLEHHEARTAPSAKPGGRARVLLVEDNLDAADALVMLLDLLGHDVEVVHDGPSALAAARTIMPDVALVDIGLPGMDGYDVASRMRALPRGGTAVLVALTGYGREEDKARALAAGFDHHLTKPVDIDTLQGLVGPLGTHQAAQRPTVH